MQRAGRVYADVTQRRDERACFRAFPFLENRALASFYDSLDPRKRVDAVSLSRNAPGVASRRLASFFCSGRDLFDGELLMANYRETFRDHRPRDSALFLNSSIDKVFTRVSFKRNKNFNACVVFYIDLLTYTALFFFYFLLRACTGCPI